MHGHEASPTVVPHAARRLWRTLAGDPTALTESTTTIIRGSRGICPPGWTGVVRLGDAFLIEAGDADDDVVHALRALGDPSDPDLVVEALRPRHTRGPGQLAYLPAGRDVAVVAGDIAEVPIDAISHWLGAVPSEDVEESSVARMDRILVLRDAGRIVGAAGHVQWPAEVAHLGVLIAPHARGAGFGSRLAACCDAAGTAAAPVPAVACRRLERRITPSRSTRRLRRGGSPVQLPPLI